MTQPAICVRCVHGKITCEEIHAYKTGAWLFTPLHFYYKITQPAPRLVCVLQDYLWKILHVTTVRRHIQQSVQYRHRKTTCEELHDGWVGSSSGTLVVRGLVSLVRLPPGTINVTAILVSGGGDHDLESATKACSKILTETNMVVASTRWPR